MLCLILQYGYGNYDPQQYPKQVTQEQQQEPQQEPQTSQSQKDQAAQKATKKVGYKFHWVKNLYRIQFVRVLASIAALTSLTCKVSQ